MIPIIVIVGPTAVGKTKLSLAFAKALNTDIISADSMQFYRELSIGTAKIKSEEKEGITHHLIDILDPKESFSVSQYQKIVRNKIDELIHLNKPVILVGGSGLYLQAALFNYQFHGNAREDETKEKYESFTNEQLFELLQSKNPLLANQTHPNNRKRILRSLEIETEINQKHQEEGKTLFYENVFFVGLNMDRKLLYQRIDERVDQMLQEGLEEEVKALYLQNIHSQSVQAIGYKEFYVYFDGLQTYEETINKIKMNSRRYAKRQLTWFHNKMTVKWYDPTQISMDEIVKDTLKA